MRPYKALSVTENLATFSWTWVCHVLSPGEDDGGKRAGLEEKIDVCILVQETCYCEHSACRNARLGSVQTGKLLLIGHCTVVVQTGQPYAGGARASRPRRPQGRTHLKAK